MIFFNADKKFDLIYSKYNLYDSLILNMYVQELQFNHSHLVNINIPLPNNFYIVMAKLLLYQHLYSHFAMNYTKLEIHMEVM